MEDILYRLWLVTRRGISSGRIKLLLERFGSVEEIYKSRVFNNIRGISDKEKAVLTDKDLTEAKRIYEKTEKLGDKIIAFDDEMYPDILRNIPDPPYVLYVRGNMPHLDDVLTIGVVGTRNCTEYGRVVTERLCRSLALSGAVTISGLARGIDSVGAWATIEAGGTTVGVTGCGLDIIYPSENLELINAITENGCVISEYPPGVPPTKNHFPQRNRIIAGLSRGLLVTEAPERSGSLITAQLALENNRDVFAVPRSITQRGYLGTNVIIQQGAKLINSAEDILCEYPYAKKITLKDVKPSIKQNTAVSIEKKKENAPPKKVDDTKYKSLNENERQIIDILKKRDMQIDEISRELKIGVSDVNTRLIMLEVKGMVKKLPGSMYKLNI